MTRTIFSVKLGSFAQSDTRKKVEDADDSTKIEGVNSLLQVFLSLVMLFQAKHFGNYDHIKVTLDNRKTNKNTDINEARKIIITSYIISLYSS